uniref:Uncharacterized protein n=1 Tax=Panagrellus redivivus TaxID=6233 RepID=A0A7E4ZQ85_PANRE
MLAQHETTISAASSISKGWSWSKEMFKGWSWSKEMPRTQSAVKSQEGSCDSGNEAAGHIPAMECDIRVPAAMFLDFFDRRLEKSDESNRHPCERPWKAESEQRSGETAEKRTITTEEKAGTSIRK